MLCIIFHYFPQIQVSFPPSSRLLHVSGALAAAEGERRFAAIAAAAVQLLAGAAGCWKQGGK